MAEQLIESLMEETGDTPDDPLNAVIVLLAPAIEDYESRNANLAAFDTRAMESVTGIPLLRVLMDQHGLGVADLPEIGSKSMVSRVLFGQRALNKRHIAPLSKRFSIDPALFF